MTTFVKPAFPQTSIRFVGETVARVAPSFADVVAIPAALDWGPLGSSADGGKVVTSFAEFEQRYGSSDTAGRRAVLSAFNGMGLPGQGGAGGVLVYRMAVAGTVAPATLTLNNTTPGAALTLTARYSGTRGNRLSVAVGDDPRDPTNFDLLRLLFDGAEVERYSYAPTNIAALAADISARSSWITAASLITGVALATTAGTALAAGNDGDVLTATEYTAATAALEFAQFSLLAFPNLTDSSIRTQVVSWVQSMEVANRPVVLVLGGAAAESLSSASTRSAAINDPHVVNLGVGTFHDALLDRDVSTAELSPRIAGILAARGEDKALTGSEIGGLSVVGSTGIATGDIRAAIDAGVTVLRRTASPDAELVIAQGVTTYTTKNSAARPYNVFSEPRFIRIMDIFIRQMKEYGDSKIVGDLPTTQEARDAVRGHAIGLLSSLLRRGLVMAENPNADPPIPAPFVSTPLPDSPELEDAILFEFGWKFTPTTNYVLGQGRVR